MKSRISAIASFLVGTFIFVLYYWTEHIGIALVGLVFIFVAIVTNGLFLIKNMANLAFEKMDKKKYLISIALLLLNIPIAFIYYKIAMKIIFRNLEMD